MFGKKHISVLLLVSFSVLIGHNLVPHQHHSETPAPYDSHSCHAFNDIVFEKYRPSGIPGPASLNTGLPAADLPGVPGPVAEAELSRLFRQQVPKQSPPGSRPASLRAPPPAV